MAKNGNKVVEGVKAMALGTFAYGEVTVNFDEWHKASVQRALERVAAHVLGNEVASKIVALNKKRETDGMPPLTEEERAVATRELQEKHILGFNDGSWGNGARAPRPVAANRLEQIRETKYRAAANDFIKLKVKEGYLEADEVDEGAEETWTSKRGEVLNFEEIKTRVLKAKQEALDAEATAQYEMELRRKESKDAKAKEVDI